METQTKHQIRCEHPRIIINPQLPELLCKYRVYVFRGKIHNLTGKGTRLYEYLYNFDYRPFAVDTNKITHDDVSMCYVVSTTDGETFPIYLEVPCGKCLVCTETKKVSYVQRCKLETQCYSSKPWFITLTYKPECKPQFGISKRHVQLFFKRFRINLERNGFDFNLRYCAVGEYGSKTHRPHYHLIVWGINTFTDVDFLAVSKILEASWSQGFVQHRLIDPSDDKGFYYTCKYLHKEHSAKFVPVRDVLDLEGHHIATEIQLENPPFFYRRGEMVASDIDVLHQHLATFGNTSNLIIDYETRGRSLRNRLCGVDTSLIKYTPLSVVLSRQFSEKD